MLRQPRNRSSRTKHLWIFSNWKSIAQTLCCIQLLFITIYFVFSSPCDNNNAQLTMSILISDNDGDEQIIYPIPVNAKDFKFNDDNNNNNNEDKNDLFSYYKEKHSLKTSLNKMLEFSDKMTHLYTDHGDSSTIFIALASYRDDECVKTIINAFETSMYPDRIRFGVFQQHNITDGDCTDYDKLINCDYNSGVNTVIHPLCGRFWQIQIDRIQYEDAKGPMYARYRSELFYNSEDFIMQIDAHTRFVPFWDNIVIDMFKRVGNDKAILTTYPKATDEKQLDWLAPISKSSTPVVAICKTKLLERSYMFKHDRGHFVHNPTHPVITPFFAAGFSFAKGHKLEKVSSDPYLPYLFDGEEILMTLRLWTNGYDLYMPDRDIIFHIYEEHRKRPLFWHHDWNKDKQKYEKKAQNRILHVLNLLQKYKPSIANNPITFNLSVDVREIEKYSLGTERNIDDFWNWIKMDFDKKECHDWCSDIQKGKIKRIPTLNE